MTALEPGVASSPRGGEPVLSVRNLVKHFPVRSSGLLRRTAGEIHAVCDVSFDLNRGETLGVVGESGCGKSTTGRAVLNLQPATSGQVMYNGRDVTQLKGKDLRGLRRELQLVFQDPYASLNPRMTVGQILRELLRLHKMVPPARLDARCRELVHLVGLPEHALASYPRQFSGGQRQRIGIARALALEPQVLVADEPVSALDVSVQANILNLLSDLKRELGLSMLFVAHNMAVVRQACDRVSVMYLGRIVETGPTDEIFSRPQHPYTRLLLASVPRMRPGYEPAATFKGEPGSAVDLPKGCRFAARCPVAFDRCLVDDPALADAGSGDHQAACHLVGATAGTLDALPTGDTTSA